MANITSKLSTKLPTQVLANKGFLAVLGSATLTAPLLAFVQNLALKNPVAARNAQIFLIVAGMVLVGIAMSVASGTIGFILIGAASGVVIAGLAPFLNRFIGGLK